jgi:protein phosphatase
MVQAAGCSDIGKIRQANEDCFLLNKPIGLYVVADGMGGHRSGGVASRIAVETIDTSMQAEASALGGMDEAPQNGSPSEAANRLLQSIALANRKVYEQSVSDMACRGMGTTVSALYLAGNSIITANVGDSPIYLVRNGEIENLYTPHTLLHDQAKVPKSMEGKISENKLGHILTRAVGIRSDVGVDLVETPCFSDDIIVICSDGLSGKINRQEIGVLVSRNDSEAACKELTDLANCRGGEDNITVIVVRITSANGTMPKRPFNPFSGMATWVKSLFRTRNGPE